MSALLDSEEGKQLQETPPLQQVKAHASQENMFLVIAISELSHQAWDFGLQNAAEEDTTHLARLTALGQTA